MAISDLAYIDETGFHTADYPAVLDYFKEEYRNIYGADTYLEEDSQDGQWIAIQARAVFDALQIGQGVYNSFSPLTAQRDALSRNVKINGMRRLTPTFSSADLNIVGQVGTTILNGIAKDDLGQKWLLPSSVTIPVGGAITVTATAEQLGATTSAANTITKISTPTKGWQSVNNPLAAVEGDPVEEDAELRKRQTVSTALPSLSVFDGTIGAVAGITGVTRYKGYENDSNVIDADGIPAHSIALVVEGGDTQEIADRIAVKKTPGTGTYGTTSATSFDQYGVPNTINFFRPTVVTTEFRVNLDAYAGYLSAYGEAIAQAIADYINGLPIGGDILNSKLYVPANLPGQPGGETFNITRIRTRINGTGGFNQDDTTLAFNQVSECDPADVTIVIN